MEWPSEPFGQLLRRLRLDAGLTQEALALAADLHPRSVSDLERGVNATARNDTARLLADALRLTGPERDAFEAAARGRPAAPVAARALPRDISSFIGREAELRRLADAAASGAGSMTIYAIGGMAGVGKTALAVHAAHLLAPRYPDGQIYLPLHAHTPGRRPVDAAEALASLLETVGVSAARIPAGLDARASIWRGQVAGKRLLLVLDDATDSEQIKPMLPAEQGILILVTSRRHLTALEDAVAVNLDALGSDEAARLFVRLAVRPGLTADDPAVAQIVALCGFLPLAIGMLSRQLHHHPMWSVADLAADLATAKDRLALMRTEDLSIAAAFDLSYDELAPDQQHLFRRLGLHPGTEIDSYAAAALDGTDVTRARSGLESLYDHYLLDEPAPGRYAFHDLIGEFARACADQDAATDRDDALGRLLDYYTRSAQVACRQLASRGQLSAGETGPDPDRADGLDAQAWLQTERSNLHAAAQSAAATGRLGHATAIAAATRDFFRSHGHWDQALSMHQSALEAAHSAGNQQAEARALADLADMQFLTDDYPSATVSYGRALQLYRGLGDRSGEARVLSSLSTVQQAAGDYDAAAAGLATALKLCRSIDDRIGEAGAFTNLGTVQYLTGDYAAAIDSLTRALSLYRQSGEGLGEADALTNLGTVQYLARDYQAAASSQNQALVLYRSLGSRLGEANALTDLATVQYLTGEHAAAADSLTKALTAFRDLGDRSGEAEALNNLGEVARATDPDEARNDHEQARQIAVAIAAPREEARALEGLGLADIAAGHREHGIERLGEALAIYRRIGSPRAENVQQQLAEWSQT